MTAHLRVGVALGGSDHAVQPSGIVQFMFCPFRANSKLTVKPS